jgi:hypothetical protein
MSAAAGNCSNPPLDDTASEPATPDSTSDRSFRQRSLSLPDSTATSLVAGTFKDRFFDGIKGGMGIFARYIPVF